MNVDKNFRSRNYLSFMRSIFLNEMNKKNVISLDFVVNDFTPHLSMKQKCSA